MPLYRKLYCHLFSSVTGALRALDAKNDGGAPQILKDAQLWCEEEYMNADEEDEERIAGNAD